MTPLYLSIYLYLASETRGIGFVSLRACVRARRSCVRFCWLVLPVSCGLGRVVKSKQDEGPDPKIDKHEGPDPKIKTSEGA